MLPTYCADGSDIPRDEAISKARDWRVSYWSCIWGTNLRDFALLFARVEVTDSTYFAGSVTKLAEHWPAMLQRLRDEGHELQLATSHVLVPMWDTQERTGPRAPSPLLRSFFAQMRVLHGSWISQAKTGSKPLLAYFSAKRLAAETDLQSSGCRMRAPSNRPGCFDHHGLRVPWVTWSRTHSLASTECCLLRDTGLPLVCCQVRVRQDRRATL